MCIQLVKQSVTNSSWYIKPCIISAKLLKLASETALERDGNTCALQWAEFIDRYGIGISYFFEAYCKKALTNELKGCAKRNEHNVLESLQREAWVLVALSINKVVLLLMKTLHWVMNTVIIMTYLSKPNVFNINIR